MITAVDTNVLVDVFGGDPEFGSRSKAALDLGIAEGVLIACDAVWAEVTASFSTPTAAVEAMADLGVEFSPVQAEASLAAGVAWAEYRHRGGSRTRVVADFLIGAHALTQADRLLTRDARFQRTYFQQLVVLDPGAF